MTLKVGGPLIVGGTPGALRGALLFRGTRAYFNMLTAGENDPAVIHFAPAVITFCLRDIKDVYDISLARVQK